MELCRLIAKSHVHLREVLEESRTPETEEIFPYRVRQQWKRALRVEGGANNTDLGIEYFFRSGWHNSVL